MASNTRNLDYNIRFRVDKNGFNQIKAALRSVMDTKIPASGGDPLGLKQSVEAARQLDSILSSSWNHKLNQLDVSKFNKSVKESFGSVEQLRAKLVSGGEQGAIAFNKIATSALTSNTQLRQTNKLLDSMATSFKNTVKWQISSKAINTVVGSIQKAYNYTKDLDTSLNNIMIVTSKNADEMDRFAINANKAAQLLAASTLDYTNASLIYYQQGLSDEEVAARTDVTLKTANVTGQSAAEVSEQLTAVWNGYKVAVEQSELYIDKLAAVAASTASDLEELSTGMSKVASTANAMGVDIDQLTAQLSTIVSVTRQAPESVGNALKTIYARMGDLKVDGVDEFGVELGDVSGMLQDVGIQVLDVQGNLRDLGVVTEEVAAKWQTWTQAQQQAVAIALAGKRQYNNLIALFENWNMYESALSTAASAAGTLQEQQDIYMQSTRAHLQRLKTEAQRTYDILFNPSMINGWTKALQVGLNFFNDFIEGIGGGTSAITAFGATLVSVFSGQIAQALVGAKQNLRILQQNANQVLAQAQYGDNISNQGGAKTGYLSNAEAAGAEAAANAYQRIYEIRKGLTAEQQKAAIETVKEISDLERKKSLLENSLQILRSYNLQSSSRKENDAWIQNFSQENQFLKELIEDLGRSQVTAESFKQKLKDVADQIQLMNQNDLTILDKDRLAILQNIQAAINGVNEAEKTGVDAVQLKNQLLEFSKQIYGENETAIFSINTALDNQQEKERGATVQVEARLLKKKEQLETTIKVGQATRNTQQILQGLSFGLSAFATGLGSVSTMLNDQADAAQRVNGLWGAIGSAASAVGFAFGGPIGAAVGRAGSQAIKAIADITGLSKKMQDIFKSTKDKIQQTRKQIQQLEKDFNSVSSKELDLNRSVANVKELSEQYDRLSTKAGAYDKNIDKLTEEERSKYNQLKETLVSYNKEILIGYNDRNQMILTQADTIEIVLEKLREEYELEKKLNFSPQKVAEYYDKRKEQRQAARKGLNEASENQERAKKQVDLYGEELTFPALNPDGTVNQKAPSRTINYGDTYRKLQKQTEQAALEYQKTIKVKTQDILDIIKYSSDLYEQTIQKYGESNSLAINSLLKFMVSSETDNFNKRHDHSDDEELIQKAVQERLRILLESLSQAELSEFFGDATAFADQFWKISGENYIDILDQRKQKIFDYIQKNKQFLSTIGKDAAEDMLSNMLGDIEVSNLNIQKGTADFIDKNADQIYNKLLGITGIQKLLGGPTDINKYGMKLRTTGQPLKGIEDLQQMATPEQIQSVLQIIDEYGNRIILYVDSLQDLIALSETLNTTSKQNVEMMSEIQAQISKGGGYDSLSKQQQKYLAGLEEEKKYLDLIADTYGSNSHEYIRAVRQLQQVEEDRYKAMLEAERGLKATKVQSLIDEKASVEQINKAIEQLIAVDRQIHIALKMDFDSDIDQAFGIIEEYEKAINTIGDDLSLSWQEVQSIIKDGYGELLIGAQAAADGMVELDKASVDAFLEAQQIKLQADKEAKIAQIDMQIELVKAQIKLLETQLQNFKELEKAQSELDRQTALDKIDHTEAELEAVRKSQAEILAQNIKTNDGISSDLMTTSGEMKTEIGTLPNSWAESGLAGRKNYKIHLDGILSDVQNTVAQAKGQIAGLQVDALLASGAIAGAVSASRASTYTAGSAKAESEKNKDNAAWRQNGGGSKSSSGSSSSSSSRNKTTPTKQQTEAQLKNARTTLGVLQGTRATIQSYSGNFDQIRSNFANTGTRDGETGKSGSKEKEAEQMDLLDKQIDIYRDINEQLEKYAKKIDRIQKAQQKLVGKELIRALEDEQALLNKQAELYKTKQGMLIQDLANRKAMLAYNGAIFDSESHLLNSAEMLRNKQAEINGLIAQYNSMSAEQQEGWKDYINDKKQEYDDLANAINEYEQLLNNEFEAIIDKLQQIKDRKIEIQIKKFNTMIDIKLNYSQAEKDLAEFRRKVQKQILDDDFLGLASDKLMDFNIYYKTNGDGEIQRLTDHVNRIMREGDIMAATGWSEIYGDNMARLLEDLKKYNDQLMESLEQVEDLVDDIHNSYLDMIDKSKSAFDKQVKTYQQIDKLISHNVNILQKIYGENVQYDSMLKWYDQRTQNNNQEIDFLRQQVDLWDRMAQSEKARLATLEEGTKEWQNSKDALDKYLDNWQSSLNDLNDKIADSVENLVNKWKTEIDNIVLKSQNDIFGGDMSKALSQWEHMVWYSDRYLDDLSRSVKLLQLDTKYQQAIDNTDDLKLQAKIQQLRDYQIKRLQEKVQLRQIDIDIAQRELELAVRQQALQDAQQAKTKMRLRRDSQGNYRYEYVADTENNQEQLENEYARIEQLRMLIKNDWMDTTQEVSSMIQNMYKEMTEAAYRYQGDEEATRKAIAEIYERYLNEEDGYITSLIRDAQEMEFKLNEATIIQLKELRDLYSSDFHKWLGLDEAADGSIIQMINDTLDQIEQEVGDLTGEGVPSILDVLKDGYLRGWYYNLTEMNRSQLMGYILPAWDSMIGRIIQLYDDRNNGLTAIIERSMSNIIKVTEQYIDELGNLESVAGISFMTIAQGIDQNIWKTQQLLQNNYQLINSYQQQMMAIQQVISSLQNLIQQFQQARQAAIEAANAAAMYYREVARQQVQVPQIPTGSYNPPATPAPGGGGSPGNGGGGNPGNGTPGGSQETHSWKIVFQDAYVTRAQTVESGTLVGNNTAPVISRFAALAGRPSASWNWKSGRGTLILYIDNKAIRSASVTKPGGASSNGGGTGGGGGGSINRPGTGRSVALSAYATGGYTGEWGNDGRLAILHQKELVLNEEDTRNILGAVNVVRGIAERLSIASASSNFCGGGANLASLVNNTSTESQNITVYADFPAANSAAEIEAAFNNIVNMASQRASQNRRTK